MDGWRVAAGLGWASWASDGKRDGDYLSGGGEWGRSLRRKCQFKCGNACMHRAASK